jgi:hypothetical protein
VEKQNADVKKVPVFPLLDRPHKVNGWLNATVRFAR